MQDIAPILPDNPNPQRHADGRWKEGNSGFNGGSRNKTGLAWYMKEVLAEVIQVGDTKMTRNEAVARVVINHALSESADKHLRAMAWKLIFDRAAPVASSAIIDAGPMQITIIKEVGPGGRQRFIDAQELTNGNGNGKRNGEPK